MNDLMTINPTEMSRDEAVETDRLIKRQINHVRYLLLDMRDRKGWKALGYESFEAYGAAELGYSKVHIYRLAEAGEISLQIGSNQLVTEQPKESQLRPLAEVPAEDRKAIWEQAQAAALEEGKKLTAKMVEEAVAEWRSKFEQTEQRVQQMEMELEARPVITNEIAVEPADYRATQEAAKRNAREWMEAEKKLKEAQAEKENALNEMEELKRKQKKAIEEGVKSEMNALERQIDDQRKTLEMYQRKANEARSEFEIENAKSMGLSLRNKALSNVNHALVVISAELFDAVDDQYVLTDEEFRGWRKAAKQLHDGYLAMTNWLDQCHHEGTVE